MNHSKNGLMATVLVEAEGLARVFMPHKDNHTVTKAVTGVFVLVWLGITLGLAFEAVDVVKPPFYGVFTAVVFLWVGKQWDLEVSRLLDKG